MWYTSKSLALYTSLFFILNWILVVAFAARPYAHSDLIVYYGIGSIVTFPLPFLVIYDFPRDRPVLFQLYLIFPQWLW